MTSRDISLFDKAKHDRTGFSCGVDLIDKLFKQSISKKIKNNRMRFWCATDKFGILVGFYALLARSVLPDDAGNMAIQSDIHEIPIVYISLLGVDKKHQNQGIGGDLLMHAIRKCVMVSDNIGVAEIVLDVEQDDGFDRRVQFYNTYGFRFIDEGDFDDKENRRMALSINAARIAVQKAS